MSFRVLESLLLQVLATSFMTGLIWFVQVVHYPLMEGWPHDGFGRWEVAHRDRTGPVVIPPMLIEGVVAVWLLRASATGCSSTFPYRWNDGSLGHLGKYIFSSSALSSAAFNRLGCSNTPAFSSIQIGYELSSGHSEWPFLSGMLWQFWLA